MKTIDDIAVEVMEAACAGLSQSSESSRRETLMFCCIDVHHVVVPFVEIGRLRSEMV